MSTVSRCSLLPLPPFSRSVPALTLVATLQASVRIRDGRAAGGPRNTWWQGLREQTLKHKPVPVTFFVPGSSNLWIPERTKQANG